jgi:phosphofructokinase-like protein
MRLGILTGGGDCPGLNAGIRAVVRRAEQRGHDVLGIRDGWRGVMDADASPLSWSDVRDILALGGTILGSSRTNPARDPAELRHAGEQLDRMGIEGLITIGGDDTLSVAAALTDAGKRVVGIPKTLDNDVWGTEGCIGFNTAASIAMEAIDRLRTTAASHHRVMIVEVMGREAGWIATAAGLAGGAEEVIVPEHPFQDGPLMGRLTARARAGLASVVVVAEGVRLPERVPAGVGGGDEIDAKDQFGHARLASRSVGETLSRWIEEQTGLETRATVLGHLVRGGAPSLTDRLLATRYGVAAVDLASDGRWGLMVALRGSSIGEVPLHEVAGRTRGVDAQFTELAAIFT